MKVIDEALSRLNSQTQACTYIDIELIFHRCGSAGNQLRCVVLDCVSELFDVSDKKLICFRQLDKVNSINSR